MSTISASASYNHHPRRHYRQSRRQHIDDDSLNHPVAVEGFNLATLIDDDSVKLLADQSPSSMATINLMTSIIDETTVNHPCVVGGLTSPSLSINDDSFNPH